MSMQREPVKVLDKGFVRLVEFMGGDQGVVDAARVSYGGVSKGAEADKKLISYLLKHFHMTPFEHAVFKFHVSAPISRETLLLRGLPMDSCPLSA
jgi:thymidylate synthase (FAD)